MHEKKDITETIRQWMEPLIMRSFQGMSHFVRSTGLSMPQFSLLMRLYYGGTCEVHDIGRHFDVSSAAASQLVDKLVQVGLVLRQESPDDRRVRRIALDATGRALVDRGIEERYRWLNDLVHELPADQRALVLKALPALTDAERRLSLGEKTRGASEGHSKAHETQPASRGAHESASRGAHESASRGAIKAPRERP
jgi:DNA-binding MarR family transcriptional regulator